MIRLLISALCLSFLACQTPKPQAPEIPDVPKPDRVWNVAFLIMEGVYNTEFTAPFDILHHTIFHTDPGMRVFSVARDHNPVKTFEGVIIQPDFGYLTDSLPPIDVLVVPSAEHHLDTDLQDSVMINWVRQTGQQAQYVMSLCDGAFVLAQAGLLENTVCTTFPSDIPAFRERFPQLDVRENVLFVHDGKAITSAGGAKSFEPALYLSELLYGQKAAIGIGKGLVIDWDLAEIPCEIIMP
ncbi:MAG: DJ-1/PfpI family protein [Bacteroidota bacterium]